MVTNTSSISIDEHRKHISHVGQLTSSHPLNMSVADGMKYCQEAVIITAVLLSGRTNASTAEGIALPEYHIASSPKRIFEHLSKNDPTGYDSRQAQELRTWLLTRSNTNWGSPRILDAHVLSVLTLGSQASAEDYSMLADLTLFHTRSQPDNACYPDVMIKHILGDYTQWKEITV